MNPSTRNPDLQGEGPLVSLPSGLQLSPQVCDRCRVKKVRCDGQLPTCGNCRASHATCITSKKLKRKTKPRRHSERQETIIDQLRARNEQLQRDLEQLRFFNQSHLQTHSPANEREKDISPQYPGCHLSGLTAPSSYTLGATQLHDQPVIKHLGRLVPSNNNIQRFAGSTTGIYFIQCAERAYKSYFNHQESFPEVINRLHLIGSSLVYRKPGDFLQGSAISSSPLLALHKSRNTYLCQITKFFQEWSSIWPILMKKQLVESFHRIFDRVEQSDLRLTEDMIALRQVFLVLSVTSYVDHAPEDSRLYYNCARECTRLAPDSGGLSELQSTLLTCLFFQLTRQHAPWIQVCGQAVRLAQSLGLHRHSRRFKFCAGEIELRKRIWWCVYAVDIACSIVHGVPKIIQDEDVDTDLPIDADLEDAAATDLSLPLPGEPTDMAIFIAYIGLLKILSTCLKSLYTTTKRRNGVTKITTLEQELSVWRHSIHHLQTRAVEHDEVLPQDSRTDPNYRHFDNQFLHFLSNVAVLLIHQPALTFDQQHPQFMKSLSSCVNAGSNILGILDHNDDNLRLHNLLPNRSSMVFQATVMCFYQHWISASLSPAPTVNLSSSLDNISNIATKILHAHIMEIDGLDTDSTGDLDRHTLCTAIHLIRSFISPHDHENFQSVAFSPTQPSPQQQDASSSYIVNQSVETHMTGLEVHERRGVSMQNEHVDFGILDEGIIDFDWF